MNFSFLLPTYSFVELFFMKNETKSPAAPVDFISALLAQEALSEEETKARADFTTSLFAYYAFAENHKIDVNNVFIPSNHLTFVFNITA